MGAWLTSILQNAGRAGSDVNEARTNNALEKQKMDQWKLQQQELKARLGQFPVENQIKTAPQVVHTYRGTDGKVHNLVRNPLDGKISDQVADGPGEMSPDEQKVSDFRRVMGREPSEDEKKILLGAESKTPRNAYAYIKPDEKGKMFGLSAQSGQWEPLPELPGSTFKAPKKATPGLNPVIVAQLGKPPDPSVYPKGEDDPLYKAKAKQWGIEAETIQNRMAMARGQGYNMSRVGPYVDPDGNLITATAGTALANGYTPAAPTFNIMSKQAQFTEMQSASGKLRSAIEALQPGDAFTPDQVAKLSLAAKAPDEGTFHAIVSNLASSTTNERQQDYLIWLQQMGERVLSLRNVAGMGQGAQDLRSAIQATLPNISSGSKEFALKRLDAVDNQISQLHQGIGKLKKPAASNVIVVSPEDLK